MQYRVHIRITEWWRHLCYYIVPVVVISIVLNIPTFTSLRVSVKNVNSYAYSPWKYPKYLIQFFHVLMINNRYTMDFFWLKFGRFLYFYLARNITFHITVRGQSILVIFCSIRIIGNEWMIKIKNIFSLDNVVNHMLNISAAIGNKMLYA